MSFFSRDWTDTNLKGSASESKALNRRSGGQDTQQRWGNTGMSRTLRPVGAECAGAPSAGLRVRAGPTVHARKRHRGAESANEIARPARAPGGSPPLPAWHRPTPPRSNARTRRRAGGRVLAGRPDGGGRLWSLPWRWLARLESSAGQYGGSGR